MISIVSPEVEEDTDETEEEADADDADVAFAVEHVEVFLPSRQDSAVE